MKKRIFGILLCLIMGTGIFTIAASASAATNLGLTVNPNNGAVMFGKTADGTATPALYHIVASDDNTLTLFYFDLNVASNSKEFDNFDSDPWQTSDICLWLNGTGFLNNRSVVTSAEANALAPYGTTETYFGQTIDVSQKVVLPSLNEATWLWGTTNSQIPGMWLRTPGSLPFFKTALLFGAPIYDLIPTYPYGIYPTFKVDISSVLMATSAVGGKTSAVGPNLAALPAISSFAKLTVKDSALTLATATTKNALQANTTITVDYTGALIGKTLSAIITRNSDNKTLDYGKISTTYSASGSVAVTLPSDFDSTTQTLKLFTEQINGDNLTDYASEPVTVTVSEMTLQEKIDAAQSGDTIQLTADVALGTTGVTILDKNIILDLSGKSISYNGIANAITFSGTGNLIIKDSAAGGKISSPNGCAVYKNSSGDLKIESGEITGNTGIASYYFGTVLITGGTVDTTNVAIFAAELSNGNVTITGGTVSSAINNTIEFNSGGKLTIGGTAVIEALQKNAIYKQPETENAGISLEITGGTILTHGTNMGILVNSSKCSFSGGSAGIIVVNYAISSLKISGGTFIRIHNGATMIVTGGSIFFIDTTTCTPVNDSGTALKEYFLTFKDAAGNNLTDTAVTSLTATPALSYTYGLTDVKTDVSGGLYVWLPDGVTNITAVAGGISYKGIIVNDNGVNRATLYLPTQTPTAQTATVAKTTATQASVTYTLTTAPTGTWKLYDSNGVVVTGVTATVSGTTLTLTADDGNLEAGTYSVSVTEPNKDESGKLTLTVIDAATVITADTTDNDVDHDLTLTFAANPTFEAAIQSISYCGTLLDPTQYTISGGTITLKPSIAINTLLRTAGTGDVVIKATGYYDSIVSQTINAGVAPSIQLKTQPTAGINSGELFVTQPILQLNDQYGNVCATGTSASATITVQQLETDWALGGTTSITAINGIATFLDLKCVTEHTGTGTLAFSDGTRSINSTSFALSKPIVDAQTPVITNDLDASVVYKYYLSNTATPFDATATVTDGGTISYAWYSNPIKSTTGATALGITTPTLTPQTTTYGVTYYFCVVTNTNDNSNGNKIAQKTSNLSVVYISQPDDPIYLGVYTPNATISASATNSKLFGNVSTVTVSADVKKAFGKSVQVDVTDFTGVVTAFDSFVQSNKRVTPFSINYFIKGTTTKLAIKDSYTVSITLPIPSSLIAVKDQIQVYFDNNGTAKAIPSTLYEKEGTSYITNCSKRQRNLCICDKQCMGESVQRCYNKRQVLFRSEICFGKRIDERNGNQCLFS